MDSQFSFAVIFLPLFNIIYIFVPIVLMQVIGSKVTKNKEDQEKLILLPNKPFDTEMSHEHQSYTIDKDDRDFSPWVHEKKNIHFDNSSQDIDYYHFLAKIKLSPRIRNKMAKNSNLEVEDQLEAIKTDLTCKMKASKISNGEFIGEKMQNKINQNKNYFQRRSNLNKIYKRPKSIDLSLQFQPRVMFKCLPTKPTRNLPNSVEIFKQASKNEPKIIHKLRKKKSISENGKEFSETMRDFRVNILNTQKRVHQTLELTISEIYKKKTNQHEFNPASKTLNMFNRPKFLKPKSEKPHKIFDDTLACLGKNALTVEHKTCRDKIRSQLKNTRNENDQAFVI